MRVKVGRIRRFGPALAVFIILIPTLRLPVSEPLSDEVGRMDQFGGGSLEEQCSSITFEDMFIYDQAIFEVRINDDWQTAQVDARAWINWTLADDIRSDLDGYLEGIVPSGGDGWLSTDEIDAVIVIAADCLEYSITRIGIRDGSSHRGGVGVDWKNTTWEGDGMQVGHYNGIPPRHSQGRDCQEFSQEGCIEIPVVPSIERDCDTDVNGSLGEDECRTELWLNATMTIQGISDPNDFTIAFNSSNMSNARLEFTFPVLPDLRMDMWEECEGRFVGPDEDNPGTDSAPIRGSCIGDGTADHELRENDDGSLTYTLESNFSRDIWPLGEDVFADFTTSPIPVDDPPVWTDSAPSNGTWVPVPQEGQAKLATWQEVSSWFDDESGVSSLEIHCDADSGGAVSESIDRSLWLNVEGLVQVSCESIDSSGQSSGARTWNIGVPLSISSSVLELQDPHPISIGLAPGWPEISVEVGLVQGGDAQNVISTTIGEEGTLSVPSTGMVPGAVIVWVKAYQDPDFYMQNLYDLGISKESSPPQIFFSEYNWDGSDLKISGQYSDPDGEDVTFTAEILGVSSDQIGEIVVSRNAWEFVWGDPSSSSSIGDYELVVTGCDQSGKCTSETFAISNEGMPVQPGENIVEVVDSGEGALPASGVFSISISALAAVILGRRRD
tara:strand:+ start:7576 stop:9579 length:2004 start_codon:yes stop_codon:yes gene_type:complete